MVFKFSVFMSVYHEDVSCNLDQCLDILANQTLHADEIVIVKDGMLPRKREEILLSWQGNRHKHHGKTLLDPFFIASSVRLTSYFL
jgi:hypothetical protein